MPSRTTWTLPAATLLAVGVVGTSQAHAAAAPSVTVAKRLFPGYLGMGADARGGAVLAWQPQRRDRDAIAVGEVAPGGRLVTHRQVLAGTRRRVTLQGVAVSPSGAVAICLSEGDANSSQVRLRIAQRLPGQRRFALRTAAKLKRLADDVRCAVDDSGAATMVWNQDLEPPNVRSVRLSAQGVAEAPVVLGLDAGEPQLAVAPGGQAAVSFSVGGPEDRRVLQVVRPAGGPWGTAVQLHATGVPVQGPVTAITPDGAALTAFNGPGDVLLGQAGMAAVPVFSIGERGAVSALATGPGGEVAMLVLSDAFVPGQDDTTDGSRQLLVRRRADGTFGPATDLGHFGFFPQALALGAAGGVVSWVTDERRGRLVARILRPGGAVGPTVKIGSTAELDIAAVSRPDGSALVLWVRGRSDLEGELRLSRVLGA